jgi:Arc/MetJ family transcription regulator
MRTNIEIEDALIEEALRVSGLKPKPAAGAGAEGG